MRKLASNEKTLFLALCGAVFLALNLLSLKVFLNINGGLQTKIVAIKEKIAEGQASIAMAETLKPATAWIKEHPLPIWTDDQASAELLKCERSEAEKNDFKIIEENLLPPHSTADADSVSVQTKLSGPFTGLVKFLFALQSPTAWRAIDKFTMKSDPEPSKVIVDIEIKQFFKNQSSSSTATAKDFVAPALETSSSTYTLSSYSPSIPSPSSAAANFKTGFKMAKLL